MRTKTGTIGDERPGSKARNASHDRIHITARFGELLRAGREKVIRQWPIGQRKENVAQEFEVHLEQDVTKVRDLTDRPQPLQCFWAARLFANSRMLEQRAQRMQVERVRDSRHVGCRRWRFERGK